MNAVEARSIFTKTLIDVYKEKNVSTAFLRSFFPNVESMTKEISIEVQRGSEKVAVDVHRHSNGNLNKFTKSTEKIFVPPFFHEYLVANEHRLYDVAIGMQSEAAFAALAMELAEQLFDLQQKIERAYELQCAQALETGIVTLTSGDNIDFKRKAASLVNSGGGTYWATGSVDPYAQMEDGANFLRQTGKAAGDIFNVIMGATAYRDFLNNTTVQNRNLLVGIKLDAVAPPQRNSVGASLHGEVSIGSYRARIWTYPQFYDTASVSNNSYVNAKKIIMLPENPRFKLAFGAVPQLIGAGGAVPQKGAYLVQEFIDEKATAHEIHIKSAGIAIPVAVDQIYTRQVVA